MAAPAQLQKATSAIPPLQIQELFGSIKKERTCESAPFACMIR